MGGAMAAVASVQCGSCGVGLEERSDVPIESRIPCPKCGSTARSFAQHLTSDITVTGSAEFEHRRQFPMSGVQARELGGVALIGLAVVGTMARPWPAEIVGVGEWGRLVALIVAVGVLQLAALVSGWWSVKRRFAGLTLVIGRSLTLGDPRAALQDPGARYAQQVEQLATENDSRIVRLIADIARVPLALLLLAWALGTWAAVWQMVRGS